MAVEDRLVPGRRTAQRCCARRFLTGDTGYSGISAILAHGSRAASTWLAVPIGAYEPRWFMKAQHVNPDESCRS